MAQHKVVDIRATGRLPEIVAKDIQSAFDAHDDEGWELVSVQPVIYNSQATGYILLFLTKP